MRREIPNLNAKQIETTWKIPNQDYYVGMKLLWKCCTQKNTVH